MAKPRRDLTEQVRLVIAGNPNMLIPHYLIHSYLYYELDHAVISDLFYEEICKTLLKEWDRVEHCHKHLIDKGSLSAGTGYYLKDYPGIVMGAAGDMVRLNQELNEKGKRKSKASN